MQERSDAILPISQGRKLRPRQLAWPLHVLRGYDQMGASSPLSPSWPGPEFEAGELIRAWARPGLSHLTSMSFIFPLAGDTPTLCDWGGNEVL